MAIYKINSDVYDIPEDVISDFERDNPNAVISYRVGKDQYEIPLHEKNGFLKHFPDAISAVEEPADAPMDFVTPKPRVDVSGPVSAQPEYKNPLTNTPEYDLESIRQSGTIETVKGERDDESRLRTTVAEKRASVVPELSQTIEDVEESKRKYRREHPILSALSGFRGSMAPSVEGIHINDPKFRNLSAASQLLNESEKLLDRHNGGSGVIEGAKSVIGGAQEAASDLNTYSMGLTEMLDNSSVLSAITKFEKGEELSSDEQHLLDAVAINMSAQAAAGDPGLGHLAGSAFVESIPFMVEMMMNPISGAGEGLGKAMTKYALKRFGKKAGSKTMEKAATIAGRVAGDAMAATGMSATSGTVGVAADATARMTGIPVYTDDFGEVAFGDVARDENGKMVLDGNGKPVPVGSVSKEGAGKALYKAFTSRSIENFSEMFGEYFGIAGKALMNTKLGKKVSSSTLMRSMDAFTTADWTKQFNQILKDGKYNGFIGETAEEYVGGLLNAAFVGDQSFEDLASTDNLVQTVAAVGLMSGIFGSVNLAGIRLTRYKARKKLEKSEKKAYDLLGEDFDELRDNISSLDPDAQEDAIKVVLASPDLDISQKKAVLDYFHKQSYYNGLKFGENKRIEEAVQAETEAVRAESNPGTGMLVEASRIDPVSGERIPGSIRGGSIDDGKEYVVWKGPDGNEEMILQTEIDRSTVRSAPIQEVIDASVEAVKESEQAKIDQDSRYSPDIPEPQLESTFMVNGKKYMFTQPTPEGWFLAQEIKEDGSLGTVTDEFDKSAYFDAKQAEIDAAEAMEEDSMETVAVQRVEDKLQEAFNTINSSQIAAENAIVSPSEESNMSSNPVAPEESPADVSEQNTSAAIPADENGNLLYHQAPVGTTLSDILDGSLDSDEIDAFVEAHKKAAGALLKKVNEKPPKMGTDKAKYLAQKKAWADRVAEAGQQVAYWSEVESVLKESRMKPGDKAAEEIKSMGEPLTGEELAAVMLANGSIKLTKESYKKETGAGEEEAKKMFGLFATPQNGGVSIERAGEVVMLTDLENGTNHFDQEDPNAGRNAIIEVLSSSRTRSDLINYIKNNRAVMAERERQAEYNAYAEWCEEMFHMSPEDYEAYEEQVMKEISEKNLSEKEYNDFMSNLADEQKSTGNENNQRNEQTRVDGIREGSREILPGEESVPAERVGRTEEGSGSTDGRLDNEDGIAQESASGEIDENGKRFVMSSDGTTIFGVIPEETGLTPAPIKLSEGFQNEENKGYGLRHIESNHGEQILAAGFPSIENFVETVAKGFTVIKKGNQRGGSETYLLEVKDKHNNTLFVELSKDGSYWNVNSAGIFNERYSKKKDIVWTLPAVSRSTNADATGVNHGTTKGETVTSGNSPQTISSYSDKDSDISAENQANDKKTFVSPERMEGENLLDYADRVVEAKKVHDEEAKVDVHPTDAQKEAGNYRKGHIKINGFDVTIEQPAGSVRSGKDANGKEWSVTMNNTYGYIRSTEGVDGDHIDVFLGPDTGSDMVYVVDQVNTDGSFDEHKVMMGFPSLDEARSAYLSNYEKGWQGLGNITGVTLDEFKKWITSSIRKTKPFVEYKSVTTSDVKKGYTIEKRHHEKKNKDIYAVNFDKRYSRDEFLKIKAEAKSHGGYYSSFGKKGYIFDESENAERFAKSVSGMKHAEEGATFEAPLIERGEDILEYASRVAEKKTSFDNKGYKVGDKVLYKGGPATIIDFENDGRPILDTGNAPVLYEIANWDDLQNLPEKNISLKAWSDMSAGERMAEAEKTPLSEDEITNASTDEVNKANAIDYLRGNHGFIQSISYLKVYEDVRNSNRNTAADSSSTNTSQLDEAGNRNGDGLGAGREGRKSLEPVDRRNGSEDVSRQRIDGPDRERSFFDNIGEGGNSNLSPSEQPVDAVSSGSIESRRGSDAGSAGSDGGQRGRKAGPNRATTDGRRDTDARRSPDARTSTEKTEVDAEIDAALREFDDILSEFKQAGKETLNLSFAGMNSRQMEILPSLISAGAKVGYTYIRKGFYSFAAWMKQMRETFGNKLRAAGLSNTEVDAFITEMWKCKLPIDGKVYTLEEWAGILGQVDLRKKIGNTLENKHKAQREAENVDVKVCDRENIAETLPFLLPQQQDDVLKAETQFFDESHNDRDHAYGKGYMFTNGTGTGKTYTGLGIVKRFIKQGKRRILILTPSQTKVTDWINDAGNLDIELNDLDKIAKAKNDGTTATTEKGEGVVITTYANFRQNKALLEDLFDLIVYDESHRLLENKDGIGTTGANQHYKLSNRNEQYAFLRLQEIDPTWNKLKEKEAEFDKKRGSIIERLKKESGVTNELTFQQGGDLPPFINGNWTIDSERSFPELNKLQKETNDLYNKYDEEIKPELERQARENIKHTKVVFLSATPFNTRENLDYAEGYIFSYPESNKQGGYSAQSPRSQFYLEHFGAGYKWRYHRLESSTINPEAVLRQEVEFSDYLQNTLQTMSGRIIDSPYDYSRDFPTVTMDKAEEFNSTMEELAHESATSHAFYAVMGDYNYTSALFESMKVGQIIPRLKEHIARGRKAVVFHRRVESKNPIVPPFRAIFAQAEKDLDGEYDASKRDEKRRKIASLRSKYAGMLKWEQGLDLRMPREQLAYAFGKEDVLFFSGKESKKVKDKAVNDFNNDESGMNIIVIQEASGKEGISLHDTTGNHQRVLVTLALPQSPITALQVEGRIYRIGNKSNAIFEYPLLGLNTELMLFGQKFNQQVSTTENLALGSQARNLRASFARGVEEHSGDVNIDFQGVGGKEFDAPNPVETDAFDSALLDYYTNQKLNGKRDSREGMDYYPTPEPLGFMMNQWARIREGENVLEPSAGHGAIARYVPRENLLTAIEPSQGLYSKLQIKVGGNGRKFENTVFENYNMSNKHDVVLMNPPFGTGGRLAVDHVAKAFQHLEEGGRIVAIIPRGSTDKKFDKWYNEQKNAVLTAEIELPDITFERAGTSVRCRVVVIDKVTNEDLRKRAASYAEHINLDDHYVKIEDFFNELRNIEVPERTIDHKAKLKKKAAPVARELRESKGVRRVLLSEDSICVSATGAWGSIEWGDKKGESLINYLSEEYERFKSNYDYAIQEKQGVREIVYGEMKDLACKLAGMTEDEMQRYINRKGDGNVRFRESSSVNADIKEANRKFNEELQRYQDGKMSNNEMFHLGNPNGAMKLILPDIPIVMRQRIITKGSVKKHNVAPESLLNMPYNLSEPIFIFKREDNALGILTEMKDRDGKNVCVAIALNKIIQDGKEILEVNDIRSIHGRNEADVIFPIVQNGTLRWVDKQKGLDWLSSASRYVQQEIVDQDLISATKIVENFQNLTPKQGEIVFEIENLSSKLHTPVTIVKDVNEITDVNEKTQLRKRSSKGWYDPKTQEIVIVLPNNRNVADAQRTFLHEAVAHSGLRKLFGDDFDTFLSNVYANANEGIRREILRRTKGNPLKLHEATEEYLADLAERGFDNKEERSLWNRIKDVFIDMLRNIGVDLRFKLSDDDLRYILWRSYRNLEEGNLLDLAEDVSMRNKWGIGDYGIRYKREATDMEDDGTIEEYEKRLRRTSFIAREAFQDSTLAIKELQDVLAKHSGKKIETWENADIAENQRSSKNTIEKESYRDNYFVPLLQQIAHLIKRGETYQEIVNYMIAKHGLERNDVFARRDADAWLKSKMDELDKKKEKKKINESDYEKHATELKEKSDRIYDKNKEKDYSGLKGLMKDVTGEIGDYNEFANTLVYDFESRNDSSTLWEKANEATIRILKKSFESGLMSKGTYDHIKGMFKYYIPLRGWDETTAADVYSYINSERSPVNSVPRKARGRDSLADNPVATIANMAESTIMQGNRNLVKQNFLNMVINHPSSIATVKEMWYVFDVENNCWRPSFPEIPPTATAQEVSMIIEEHGKRMKDLEEQNLARRNIQGLDVKYQILPDEASEHIVSVKRNGKEYVIFINGNPRAAQAVNGFTNPDAEDNIILLGISKLNRQLAANFTTRNPGFVGANLSRDLIFAMSAVAVKENSAYSSRFRSNIGKSMAVVYRGVVKGKLDMSNEADRYFKEFLENGGETGYTALTNVDQYKKKIQKDLEGLTGNYTYTVGVKRTKNEEGEKVWTKKTVTSKTDYFKAIRYMADRFSDLNRWAEDISRFTTYMTSRQEGRGIVESVNDAKEVTVNFNRKGAGYKAMIKNRPWYSAANVLGASAGIFRNLFLFFNAGVQSLENFGKLAIRNKKGFGKLIGGFTVAGFLNPFLNQWLSSLWGDDKDYYNDLSDWTRRNNMCIYAGRGRFVTIPLSIELRAFWGLGDLCYQNTIGKAGMTGEEIAYDAINQITELLPLNPLGNNGDPISTLMPDMMKPFWQLNQNEDFTGKPVYKENDFNQNSPEWTKAYKGTASWLVNLSEWTNELGGGDKYRTSDVSMLNWNPAKIEHLFEAYFGGLGKTFNQLGKTLWYGVESVLTGKKSDNLVARNVPVLNRFLKTVDEKSSFSKVNNQYYRYVKVYDEIDRVLKGYAKEVSSGNLEYLDKLTGLQNSGDYKKLEIVQEYKKQIEILEGLRNNISEKNKVEYDNIQNLIIKTKSAMVEELDR